MNRGFEQTTGTNIVHYFKVPATFSFLVTWNFRRISDGHSEKNIQNWDMAKGTRLQFSHAQKCVWLCCVVSNAKAACLWLFRRIWPLTWLWFQLHTLIPFPAECHKHFTFFSVSYVISFRGFSFFLLIFANFFLFLVQLNLSWLLKKTVFQKKIFCVSLFTHNTGPRVRMLIYFFSFFSLPWRDDDGGGGEGAREFKFAPSPTPFGVSIIVLSGFWAPGLKFWPFEGLILD